MTEFNTGDVLVNKETLEEVKVICCFDLTFVGECGKVYSVLDFKPKEEN